MKTQESEKQRSFEREALPHADLLYSYALRMTNNRADADDLVQETYLKAYRFWESYEQGTNIRAWLFRILKNSYINRYRKEVREPDKVEYDDVKSLYTTRGEGTADQNDLQESMFGNLLDDEITTAIASLPDEFRTVVILCDIETLTYEEVATFMDCPLGTVRSRLHRGRKLLRGRLTEYARQRGLAQEQ
jgi:RNA polymerase sigma-70 factor (ECF subfamily)